MHPSPAQDSTNPVVAGLWTKNPIDSADVDLRVVAENRSNQEDVHHRQHSEEVAAVVMLEVAEAARAGHRAQENRLP